MPRRNPVPDVYIGGEPYRHVHSARTETEVMASKKVQKLRRAGKKLIVTKHPWGHKWDVYVRLPVILPESNMELAFSNYLRTRK